MKIVLESNGILDSYMDNWHNLNDKLDNAWLGNTKNRLTREMNCLETKVKNEMKTLTKEFLRQFGMSYNDIEGEIIWQVDKIFLKPENYRGKMKESYQIHASFDFKVKE